MFVFVYVSMCVRVCMCMWVRVLVYVYLESSVGNSCVQSLVLSFIIINFVPGCELNPVCSFLSGIWCKFYNVNYALAGVLVGRRSSCLVGRLVGWLVGPSCDWFVGPLIG